MLMGYERVVKVARSHAVVNPDKVAERFYKPATKGVGCRYVAPDGCPSCYVGVVLADLGFDMMDIRGLDAGHGGLGCPPLCGMNKRHEGGGESFWAENFTLRAAKFLKVIQVQQDEGDPWGQCYRIALKDGLAAQPVR